MKKLTITIFLLFLILSLFAQKAPPLERLISLKITNAKIDDALKMIAATGNFTFSYNPDALVIEKKISLNAQNQSVREILNQVFENKVSFKNRGNYVILKKIEEEPKKDFFVMGYVSDGETGLKIEQVSIYEPLSLASAVTNQYGYYKIKLSAEINQISLLVRKQNYRGESVSIKTKQDKLLNIRLLPVIAEEKFSSPLKVSTSLLKSISYRTDTLPNNKIDSIQVVLPQSSIRDTSIISKKSNKINGTDFRDEWESAKETFTQAGDDLMFWFLTKKQGIHRSNVKDTIYRNLQISFVPYIGTNHVMSGSVINDVSFNIWAGYSLGVRVMEFGGVLNMVRGDVKGIQGSGFMNLVGRDTKGVQAAGFMNISGRNMFGVQSAGFANIDIGNVSGVQASSFANFAAKSFYGVQGAGFANIVIKEMKGGVQGAGFFNLVGSDGKGFQGAGFMNFVGGSFDGIQAAGFMNFTRKTHNGLQIGVVNYAKEVKNGTQIAVVNFAKSTNSIPIGLASFVGNGYKRLEINYDNVMALNTTFKTGVKRFYNIFTAGYNFGANTRPAYSFGYGLGTAFRIRRGFWINLDVVSSKIQEEKSEILWQNISSLSKASLGLEFHISRQFALFFAPTFNVYTTERTNIATGFVGKWNTKERNGVWFGENVKHISWLGFQAGIRICSRGV